MAMSMDRDYLVDITENEMIAMIKAYCDYNKLLTPIKEHNRAYRQYTARLGQMKKTSPLVQINLPKIAVELYKKRDGNFVSVIDECIDNANLEFVGTFEQIVGEGKDVAEVGFDELVKAIETWRNDPNQSVLFNVDTFIPNMKIAYWLPLISTEEKLREYLFGKDEKKTSDQDTAEYKQLEIDLTNVDKPSNESPKPKPKKKTAQEKAEHMKQAIERKRLAQLKVEQEERNSSEEILDESENEKEPQLSLSEIVSQYEAQHNDEPADMDLGVTEEKAKMGEIIRKKNCYVGRIDIRSTFYNFAPMGEWDGVDFIQFREREVEQLIPQSNFHNINLYYNIYDDNIVRTMKETFHQDQLMVFEFELDNLEDNVDYSGTRNNTGYKVSAIDMIKNGKIRPLSNDGLYKVYPSDIVDGDLQNSKIVNLISDIEELYDGEEILINLKNEFYAGPYKVKYSPTSNKFFIRPQGDDTKYLLSGYNASDCKRNTIEIASDDLWQNDRNWIVYSIKEGAEPIVQDVITDLELLESVKDYLGDGEGDNVDELIANGDNSIFGSDIPDEIVENRLERIKSLLTQKDKIAGNINQISDIVANLILNNTNDQISNEIIEKIIESRPDFLDKIPSVRILRDRIKGYEDDIDNLDQRKSQISQEIEEYRQNEKKKVDADISQEIKRRQESAEYLSIEENIAQLKEEENSISNRIAFLNEHKAHLEQDSKALEVSLVNMINQSSGKIADITFDGFISSKMIQAASAWESGEEDERFNNNVENVNSIESSEMTSEELIEYIVNTIKKVRPQYGRNMLVNLMICITQGFITVFSGAPGCGKTSICNIIGKTLGLNKFKDVLSYDNQDLNVERYISVSVERGWTSKRDFVGYYNPLTKSFEESNRDVFDALRMMNLEKRKDYRKFPYLILLDEANLSPMEYYWADFMNVCDDITDNDQINLGNGNSFLVPDTLHFVATINNDHTTETLSPRLIDRAWVISLPRLSVLNYNNKLQEDELRIVSWTDMCNAFSVPDNADLEFDSEIQRIFDELQRVLNKADIAISPRIEIAIHRYWYAASRMMERDEYGNTPGMIAFDYIVAQKILPKINGSGETYKEWLKSSLLKFCTDYNLMISRDIVQNIINRGDRQLYYYQFFN